VTGASYPVVVVDEPGAVEWFAVRCVFQLPSEEGFAYEERVTLWQAKSSEEAIALAEVEATDYIEGIGLTYLELAQSFHLFEPPGSGKEVFSLTRESALPPREYLDAFFDTGAELQDRQKAE
jgi:hypothetical protein